MRHSPKVYTNLDKPKTKTRSGKAAERSGESVHPAKHVEIAREKRIFGIHNRSGCVPCRSGQSYGISLVAGQSSIDCGCFCQQHDASPSFSGYRLRVQRHEPPNASTGEGFSQPAGRIVSAMLGAGQSDSSLIAAFRERFLKPRRQEAYATLRRGISRGQLRKNIDMDLLLDSLYGPIYMRFLIQHDGLTSKFVESLCEQTLRAPCNHAKPPRRTARRS